MSVARHQTLRVLDGRYVLDRPADGTDVDLRTDVLAVVFGPDGSTVMRRNDAGEDSWAALWNGDNALVLMANIAAKLVCPAPSSSICVRLKRICSLNIAFAIRPVVAPI